MLLPWYHGFPAASAYQEIESTWQMGVLKSGDVPVLEMSLNQHIIKTTHQHIKQITSHLTSPTRGHNINININHHNVQPSQPQAQQLLLFNPVRGQQQPNGSQQHQRKPHQATQQRQQRSRHLHAVRPSQQPMAVQRHVTHGHG